MPKDVFLKFPVLQDVHSIISGKLALKYSGRDIEAMRAIATAHHDRSLDGFEKTLKTYEHELSQDAIIQSHLSDLYTTMLEQNLGRLIEPFSRVEISHLAGLMKLDAKIVETTLSRMILDHKLAAILDQGTRAFEMSVCGLASDMSTHASSSAQVRDV